MPTNSLKGMAKKAGISYKKAEKYWKEAKQSAKKQGIHKKDDENRYYAYVMGIVTRRMKYDDVKDKEEAEMTTAQIIKQIKARLKNNPEVALFDRPYPLKWRKTTVYDTFQATFKTKDNRDGIVQFAAKPKDTMTETDELQWKVDVVSHIQGQSTDSIGKGDSIAIFSTIVHAINEMLQQKFEQISQFSSDNIIHINLIFRKGVKKQRLEQFDTKLKLYKRMIKKFASKQGFVLRTLKDYDAITEFHLMRKK